MLLLLVSLLLQPILFKQLLFREQLTCRTNFISRESDLTRVASEERQLILSEVRESIEEKETGQMDLIDLTYGSSIQTIPSINDRESLPRQEVKSWEESWPL